MGAYESVEIEWITLGDGVRLAARIWMPESAQATPAPALLEYIPYRRRDFTRLRDEGIHARLAERGYVSVRVDMRGSGDSEGIMTDEYTEQEILDGVAVVEWLASQPWCDGNVGMFGKSWGAYSSLQVAARRPAALKAIMPVMGTDDRWLEDVHFYGGVLNKDNFWWGAMMQNLISRAPDPAIVGEERWRELWKQRLDAQGLWPATWLEHQTKDEMWIHGSVSADYNAVVTPCYFVGGWNDLYRDTPFRLAQHLKSPVKVLMGPWGHVYPHEAVPGPQIDFIGEMVAWFDHWLRGIDTGLMQEPKLRFWLQDTVAPSVSLDEQPGRWIEEPSWPSPNVASSQLWLGEGGSLRAARPEAEVVLRVCSPSDYGKAAGDMFSMATPGDRPADQRIDAGGALLFHTEPLDVAVDVVGQPSVELVVAVDKPSAFVSVSLIDEDEVGTQVLISRGFANLNHRQGPESAVPVVPGERMRITVPLVGVAQRIAPGHRLMLHVASTNWPGLWPSPERAALSVFLGESALHLPVRAVRSDPAPRVMLKPAPELESPRYSVTRPGSIYRGWETDIIGEVTRYRLAIQGGVLGPIGDIVLHETGTEMGSNYEMVHEIGDDPLSARSVITQDDYFRRDDWRTSSTSRVEMRATASHFILEAEMKCFDGDALFYEAEWRHEIERNGQ